MEYVDTRPGPQRPARSESDGPAPPSVTVTVKVLTQKLQSHQPHCLQACLLAQSWLFSCETLCIKAICQWCCASELPVPQCHCSSLINGEVGWWQLGAAWEGLQSSQARHTKRTTIESFKLPVGCRQLSQLESRAA
jgi:hypothetical protein